MSLKKWWWLPLPALGLLYALGPQPSQPKLDGILPQVPTELPALEQWLNRQEANFKTIRPDNQARIVWANDSLKQKTQVSVVYIHGFSASQAEGEPIHREFARRYGCNLYLARLAGHGLDTADTFIDLTPEQLVASAKQAVAVGQQLGQEVVLMATSTGASLALYIASQNPDIKGLILYSPLIRLYDPASVILDKPWGLQFARLVFGSETTRYPEAFPNEKQFWTKDYRLEGIISLRSLIAHSMTPENFQAVRQPTLVAYYYKNEQEQDQVVSVEAMREMFVELGTPADKKREIALPNVGDHVIASYLKSKDLDAVRKTTYSFAEEVLGLKPVQQQPNNPDTSR
jgi:pimeloyl-ACP methyl ester carboxylesterase